MRRHKKIRVCLSKMNTPCGVVPVLGNFQTVNRPIEIFSAERFDGYGNESVFFMVRPKDAQKFIDDGWFVQSVVLNPGYEPRLIRYSGDNNSTLDTTLLF